MREHQKEQPPQGMLTPQTNGEEKIVFQSRLFACVEQPVKIGEKKLNFEFARRSPGVRIIFLKDDKIMLTKEYRWEQQGYDYRLPGGKVFDTSKEFEQARMQGINTLDEARKAAFKEAEEETGSKPEKLNYLYTTTPGASVIWDLHYFLVDTFTQGTKADNADEGEIIFPEWKTFEQVKEMCLNGQVKEERSAVVLLRFIEGKLKSE